MSLTDDELDRYARHIVLREIGGPGQARLRAASVLVIGAGGLGSPLLMYLAAAGVGTLTIVDDDIVSLSNLQRQVLHLTSRIGTLKTFSATQMIGDINPGVKVVSYPLRLTPQNVRNIVKGHDLVCDGSDNFDTRYLLNETCVKLGVPLISGAIGQWDGQLSLYDPANDTPCYACVFPEQPSDGLSRNCSEAGVVGALPGVIGSMMAMEAIKHIARAGETLAGRMFVYDALSVEARTLKLHRNPDCMICRRPRPKKAR